ncbi:MAG: hypothetical protein UV99_C0015G0007 [Parcubacteria group bacterium GW2011_GWC1_43_61]|nr:MAG: hypothetical protein UU33_C0001G0184 [Candidatus Azambacteria bacterium GW2011_GWF1_41_10]KKS49043.1 MAG: hypothetical protein UV14_C0002G0040 [Candidatus Azambacteria bacterium GW2011_GWF2_42_22]KKT03203.1 MAG: hypothetical protein UV81_C0003G0070 [Candidatus Azambacteria bacterium GW2011_GWD1_43_18]KKT16353.1 MAG: hypothetical protein UV99_C0015G0007 [Parcubacteria group bacterium GW2011_GWC1_43_61]
MKTRLILAGCFVFLCSVLSIVWVYNQSLGLGYGLGYSIGIGIAFGLCLMVFLVLVCLCILYRKNFMGSSLP